MEIIQASHGSNSGRCGEYRNSLLTYKQDIMPKYKLQEMPDIKNDGKRKVYPKLDTYRLIGSKEFIKILHSYQRAIDKGVLTAVMMDMARVMMLKLSEGYNIKIDDVGTFSLSLAFKDEKPTEMEADDDAMSYRRVEVNNVNFKADPRLLKELRMRTKFEREHSGVKVIKKNLYSLEQRVERALKVIDHDGFITMTGYAALNNLSRTVASRELKEICSDQSSPMQPRGRGTHKVWVRRVTE